jgi:hypothetical protein
MSQSGRMPSGEEIMTVMIDLTRLSASHRVIVAGSHAFDMYVGLLQRGFARVATTTTCRSPCGQHDAALVVGPHSIRTIETLLVRLAPFLSTRAVLAVWVAAGEHVRGQELQVLLERLGFRIEAGARCEDGFILSARRREWSPLADAA